MKTTPDRVSSLAPNHVFCFGSNLAGRHGKGAALQARLEFGAVPGQGTGLMGRSYGLATKGHFLEILPLAAVSQQVDQFIQCALAHPELEFLVTKIGCGLAEHTPDEVRRTCFAGKHFPANVWLPVEFQSVTPAQVS